MFNIPIRDENKPSFVQVFQEGLHAGMELGSNVRNEAARRESELAYSSGFLKGFEAAQGFFAKQLAALASEVATLRIQNNVKRKVR